MQLRVLLLHDPDKLNVPDMILSYTSTCPPPPAIEHSQVGLHGRRVNEGVAEGLHLMMCVSYEPSRNITCTASDIVLVANASWLSSHDFAGVLAY